MRTAVTRGRLTELLGKDMLDATEQDNLFIVGVFSLLDAMLEMPMEKYWINFPCRSRLPMRYCTGKASTAHFWN